MSRPLHPALVDELAGSVVGLVLDGTDACSTYELDARSAPAVLVEAVNPADVAAAIRFAAAQHLPLTVQSRSAPGPSAAGTVLLSTAGMRGVWLYPTSRTARVEAGVRWAAVLEAAAPHGLAAVTGPSAGGNVVADVLRGGVGPLARAHGVAADHVRRLQVVTADGGVRTVGTDQDAGGHRAVVRGAVRGVVTALELALVEIGQVRSGAFLIAGVDAPSVAHGARHISPPELVELRQGRAGSFQVTVAGAPGARAAVALSPWTVEDQRSDR